MLTMKQLVDEAIVEVLAAAEHPIGAPQLRALAVPRLAPRMLGEIRAVDLTVHQFLLEAKSLAREGKILMSDGFGGQLMFSALAKPLPTLQAESLDLVAGALEELRAMKKLLDERGAPMTAMAIIDLCEHWIGERGAVYSERQSVLTWLRYRVMMAALRGITVSLPEQSGASS